jgi:hypothetical protein
MKILILSIFSIFLSQIGFCTSIETATFCKWDAGDVIFTKTLKDGQIKLEQSIDTDAGVLKITIDDFTVKKTYGTLEFKEKGQITTRRARCFVTTN